MSKFITLTNNLGQHKGDAIVVNVNHIISILDLPSADGYITKVNVYPGIEYTVEESARSIAAELELKQICSQ